MQDPNFEKQVQRKMEELKFNPSGAVWEKIEAEINKEKKRRAPLFWLFFFLGLPVAGTVYYMATNTKNKSVVIINSSFKKEELPLIKKQEPAQTIVASSETIAGSPTSKKGTAINISIEEKNKKIKSTQQYKNVTDNNEKTLLVRADKSDNIKNEGVINQNSSKTLPAETSEKNNELTASNNKDVKSKNINNPVTNKINDSTEFAKQQNEKNDSTKNIKATVIANKKPIANDSLSNKTIAKNNKKAKINSHWKTGITANTGLSDINQSLFKSTYVSSAAYNPNNNVNTPTNPTVSNTYTSSVINPGFSFNAGVFIKKLFSPRISFSAGLNYHYYSTRIKTGSYSDSSSYVYSSNLTPTSVSGFYNNGYINSYTNHYHFLELPLSMGFQVNKNKKLPIIWEAGLSVLYLINTDALHFDQVTGVYYKNNDLFNKTQANAETAVIIGFPVYGNILQIGPQLQYGFTRLLNKNTSNTEHLFFTGIKISTTFGKK